MASAFPSSREGYARNENNPEGTPSSASAFSSSAPPTLSVLAVSARAASPLIAGSTTPSSTATTPATSIPINGGQKRRKALPGTRGVANLTPEQLAKKRANDREAQRAIRERQRLKIEQYEREIQELRSQPPYQELQAVIQQKEAAEQELAEIKVVLRSIMAMVQPIVAAPASAPPPLSPAQTHHLSPHPRPHLAATQASQTPASTALNQGSTPSSAASPHSAGYHHGRWSNSLSPVVAPISTAGDHAAQPSPRTQAGLLNQQRHDLIHGLDLGPDRLGLDFLLDSHQKVARMQSNSAQDSPQHRHAPMKHDWTGATISPVAPSRQLNTAQTTAPYIRSPVAIASSGPPSSLFNLLPQNSSPTCPLDSILLDFLSERRQRFTDGQLTAAEIVGPRYPSVSSLLNPSVSMYSHPLSKVFTDILARFPNLSTLPERVAVLYVMFLLMRWQVYPTQENFDRLPVWFRPLPIQTTRPHPAWIDHLPFPAMRERIIEQYYSPASSSSSSFASESNQFPFENFFIPFTSTLCLNWGYEDTDVLLRMPGGGGGGEEEGEDKDGEGGMGDLMINPVFERHLGRLENWTLGEAFEKAFPALRGTYRLKRG
ncbi:BZIP transcription factor [Cladorrhinum samala]|uniref:BZIP transcription factor n=1 Tax=Cladorrhinum samala TaxID=585594 RepID=A0AAV9HA87_9PEZI|nr:BZIP transcription factor [Cladorrhinum samala]